MKEKDGVYRLLMGLSLPGEIPPGWPLIEILGNQRILIENLDGVSCYDRCTVTVKVRFGAVCVTGDQLELRQMTKSQLVITGKIYGVSLLGGN